METIDLDSMLKAFDQEHLLKFFDDLDEDQQLMFSNELKSIDYKRISKLYHKAKTELNSPQLKKDDYMEPLSSDIVGEKATASTELRQKWWDEGLKQVSEGSVGVILLAGGQGTRLGFNHPKGMYTVGLPSNKTLYQLQAERILKVQQLAAEKYGKECCIRWYIMTSDSTLRDTRDYYETNSYFGLDSANVIFFEQHQLPCLTFEGKLILSSKGTVAKAPDGNGGLYAALKSANIVGDMEAHGVEHVFVYCVDNILVKVADPSFMGYCSLKGVDAANKVIEKIEPNEAVGVVCRCQGKYQVIEYSEISQATAEKRKEDGRLLFNDANICLHYFKVSFLKTIITEHLDEMPHHIAKKKIPYIDENGETVKPTGPNGMKLEKFVFDVFQYTDNFAVFVCERSEEFSPLKNSPETPKNSPISCRQDTFNLHRKYLKAAGATFVSQNGIEDESSTPCEISALVSYAGEGLEEYKGERFLIGSTIHLEPSTNSPKHKKQKN